MLRMRSWKGYNQKAKPPLSLTIGGSTDGKQTVMGLTLEPSVPCYKTFLQQAMPPE